MKKYFIVSDTHSFYQPLMKALDDKGFSGDLKDKTGIIRLDPGEEFRTQYEISSVSLI